MVPTNLGNFRDATLFSARLINQRPSAIKSFFLKPWNICSYVSMSYSPFEFHLLSREGGEGGGFYGIESRADVRKLDVYEGTGEGFTFTGVSEAL